MDRNYKSWGQKLFYFPNLLVIRGKSFIYNIEITKESTLVKLIKNGNTIFTFTDLDFNEERFIRKCGLQKKKYIFFFKL